MFFIVPETSGAASLAPGESYAAAWPGYALERFKTCEEARNHCPNGFKVVAAAMLPTSNRDGDPLWCIIGLAQPTEDTAE